MTISEENALISNLVETICTINGGKVLTESEITTQAEALISSFKDKYGAIASKIDKIVEDYIDRYGKKTFAQSIVLDNKETESSWLSIKKDSMNDEDFAFSERYRDFLINSEKLGEQTSDYILSEAESILSYCADPSASRLHKKGLVMGDVQSGKTANYLALANLAFDYGYRIVLILSGITESLRIQTQTRVDKGIVGAKSSTINSIYPSRYYLAQKHKVDKFAIPLTDDKKDFTPDPHVNSPDLNKPQILVVKKNKSVLENVKNWLKPGKNFVSSDNILIIDDECDNASVNTRLDSNPTTINGLIRDIFNNFPCATYVGYTATPFANIFIKSNDNDPTYRDLFPSDFIYRLKTSDPSYFGIEKVFGDDDSYITYLHEDEHILLNPTHKISLANQLHSIPESLKDAICTFLLCNCVRTLRGDKTSHRSMMINVSRFNGVQESVQTCVNEYLKLLKNSITFNYKLGMDRFMARPELKRIYDLYLEPMFDKARSEFSFEQVKMLLDSEVEQFFTTLINSQVKDEDIFRYDDDIYKDGARVIAIGGFSLSRGLTLEGLMISYYSRNTNAYDTLLQMCRWFGYRYKYEDLCKIYMTHDNYERFCVVVEAIDNLDDQLYKMSFNGQKPENYGLMIDETPYLLDTKLICTSPGKTRNSFLVDRDLDLSCSVIDTSKLSSDIEKIKKNASFVDDLISVLIGDGHHIEVCKNRTMFRDIPKKYIADFISNLIVPPENNSFKVNSLSNFIRKGTYFDSWDIVFTTGQSSNSLVLQDNGITYSIPLAKRSFIFENNRKILTFYKSHNRMIDPGIFDSGLTDEQRKEARAYAEERIARNNNKSKSLIYEDYLSVEGRKPLLVILPVQLLDTESPTDKTLVPEKQEYANLISESGSILYAFGIGIPGKKETKILMRFRENLIKHKEDLDDEYNDLEDDDYD